MIDRGALVLEILATRSYRGVQRPALDAQAFTGRRGKDIARKYREAIIAGEGVIEDLDEALALMASAVKIGITQLEVIVFEIPQEPAPSPRALPIAAIPPAEGLTLLGYDVIETLEPFCSPLNNETAPVAVNPNGLLNDRASADELARAHTIANPDDPAIAVRIWRAV